MTRLFGWLAVAGICLGCGEARPEEPKPAIDLQKAREFVVEYVKDAKRTPEQKPKYSVVKKSGSDEKELIFTMGQSSRVATESSTSPDNAVVDMLNTVEQLRAYPPEKVNKGAWATSLEECDRIVAEFVARHNKGLVPGNMLDKAVQDTRRRLDTAILDAMNAQAPVNGAKSARPVGLVRATLVKIVTDPAGGKVYLMSDFGWRQCEMLGREPKEVIKTCAAGDSVYGLEGTVWCWAQWPDGNTSGPEKRTVTGDTFKVQR